MIRFHPAPSSRKAEGPPSPSVHEIVNHAVADLDVVCVGVDDGTIYFERMGAKKKDINDLAQEIIGRLTRLPEATRAILERTTDKVAIR